MRDIRFGLFMMAILLVLAGCGTNEPADYTVETIDGVENVHNLSGLDTTRFPYTFELEQAFGAEEEPLDATFASVSSIAVTDDGTLIALDRGNSRIMAFDENGQHLWNAGSEGEGPEELMYARGLALLGDSLILLDNQGSSRIDRWTVDGSFVDGHLWPENTGSGSSLKGIVSSKVLVLTSSLRGGFGTQMWFLDADSYELLDSAQLVQPVDLELPGSISIGSAAAISSDQVHVGTSTDEYGIWEYDADGRMTRAITLQADHLNLPGVYENGVAGTGGMYGLYPFPDGTLLAYVSWMDLDDPNAYAREVYSGNRPDVKTHRSLDAFSDEGRYLGSMVLTGGDASIGTPLGTDSQGNFYTYVRSPWPQIYKYRVVRKQ